MRARFVTIPLSLALLISSSATLTACASADDCTTLHNKTLGGQLEDSKNGTTLYADLWDTTSARGDRADFEQKPDSNTWVIADGVAYGSRKKGDCTVEIKVENGDFVVTNLNGTKAGKDHDHGVGDDEIVVIPHKDLKYTFE